MTLINKVLALGYFTRLSTESEIDISIALSSYKSCPKLYKTILIIGHSYPLNTLLSNKYLPIYCKFLASMS